MVRPALTAVVLGCLAGAAARAEDPPALDAPVRLDRTRPVWPWAQEAPVAAGAGPSLEPDHPYPRVRLEAYARITAGIQSRVKHGRQGVAGSFETGHDAHVPNTPAFGYRFIVDARVHERVSLGVHYTRVVVEGPRRRIHYRGIGLGDTRLPGGTPVETTIDLQVGEVFARYVVKDSETIRFAIGLGAAWASHRVRLSSDVGSAGGRVETFFFPTVSYWLSVRLFPFVSVFFESLSGMIAPLRFPSLLSELRGGLRWHLGDRLELLTAVGSSWGMISDLDDHFGGRRTGSHRWRRATWSAIGGELGLAFTF
ncbi:MAG: hypothetical protein M9894_20225 [Planctomycetes bacterium]|nr:hypothetical protein [Planctomycetota bacterium]